MSRMGDGQGVEQPSPSAGVEPGNEGHEVGLVLRSPRLGLEQEDHLGSEVGHAVGGDPSDGAQRQPDSAVSLEDPRLTVGRGQKEIEDPRG